MLLTEIFDSKHDIDVIHNTNTEFLCNTTINNKTYACEFSIIPKYTKQRIIPKFINQYEKLKDVNPDEVWGLIFGDIKTYKDEQLMNYSLTNLNNQNAVFSFVKQSFELFYKKQSPRWVLFVGNEKRSGLYLKMFKRYKPNLKHYNCDINGLNFTLIELGN